MAHLPALPGSPHGETADLGLVCEAALADVAALKDGGADGVVVENFGDAPFAGARVGPETVAQMTRVALAVRRVWPDALLGVNVLRNDAGAAMAVAAAVGADFVRVNVHVGAMVTDQGLLEGAARNTLLLRRRLGANNVAIAADVMVKHAVPLGAQRLTDLAADTWHRGAADALIVTGAGTGQPTAPADVQTLRLHLPEAPVWVGSGLDPESARHLRDRIDGAIVGSWLHRDGRLAQRLDAERVRAVAKALKG